VEAFFERLKSQNQDTRSLQGIRVGAIGPATSRALEAQGLKADYCPAVYTTRGILEGLKGRDIAGKRFLLPRADIADKELTHGLIDLGAEVDEVVAYKTKPAAADLGRAKQILEAGEIDVITFTSTSTVANLVNALGNSGVKLSGAKVACIGPKTVEAAKKAGLPVDIIATEQTIPGLVEAITEYYQRRENE
jgi:uroporphyrinogen III methyltransferase / synthase